MKTFAPGVIKKVKCYLFILIKHLYLFSYRKEITRYALSKLSSSHSASFSGNQGQTGWPYKKS